MKAKAITKICVCGVAALLLITLLLGLTLLPSAQGLRSWLGSLPFVDIGGMNYADEESYSIGDGVSSDPFNRVEVYWASGSVRICAADGDEIRISETGATGEKNRLRWRVQDGTLCIRFASSALRFNSPKKTLELELPAGLLQQIDLDIAAADVSLTELEANTLSIDAASGSINASRCAFRLVEIDAASAQCSFDACTLGSFDMDAASGSARLSGSVERIAFDAASGDLYVVSELAPRSIDFDTASGDADITLPADAGFCVEYNAASGELEILGFAGNYRGDEFYCGDGGGQYRFDTVSGDVIVRAAGE